MSLKKLTRLTLDASDAVDIAEACTNPDIALVDAWTRILTLPSKGMEQYQGQRREAFIDLAAAALALAANEPKPLENPR